MGRKPGFWLNEGVLKKAAFAAFAVFAAPTIATASALEIYEENCSACHLENGAGDADMRTPSIAGLDETYVARQLDNLRAGVRTFSEEQALAQGMIEIVKELPDADIEALSTYVASMPVVELEQETGPISFADRGLYSGCLSCHGAKGQGFPKLGAPRLSNQYIWYLREQIVAFRKGDRGSHESDDFGRQMREMAEGIRSEEDIDRLVNYIARFEQ